MPKTKNKKTPGIINHAESCSISALTCDLCDCGEFRRLMPDFDIMDIKTKVLLLKHQRSFGVLNMTKEKPVPKLLPCDCAGWQIYMEMPAASPRGEYPGQGVFIYCPWCGTKRQELSHRG